MAIPVYRHNQDHDDWEVASLYDSDDSDSLGRSAYNESLYESRPFDNPPLGTQGHHYDDTLPNIRYSVPPDYDPGASSGPRWDARLVPRKQSRFIVPPPGVIIPSQDWLAPAQDSHWSSTASQPSPSNKPLSVGLNEPPPPSLLLSPSSPPRTPSPLIGLPSPTTIVHGHPPRAMSGTGSSVNTHGSAMPPPPRFHEVARTNAPRLAEGGCQVPPGTVMIPRRRIAAGHDVLSPSPSYTSGGGQVVKFRAQSNEEGVGHGCGPRDRADLDGYEREHHVGTSRMGWSECSRERRPSIWRRFVRRFSPAHVSVGHS